MRAQMPAFLLIIPQLYGKCYKKRKKRGPKAGKIPLSVTFSVLIRKRNAFDCQWFVAGEDKSDITDGVSRRYRAVPALGR